MQLRLGMLGAPHVDAFVLRSWRRRCIGEAKLRDQLKVASSVQEGLGTPFFAAFSPLVLSQLEQIPEPISQKGDLLTKWDVTMLVASIMSARTVLAADLVAQARDGNEVDVQPRIFQPRRCGLAPDWPNEPISLSRVHTVCRLTPIRHLPQIANSFQLVNVIQQCLAMHHQDGNIHPYTHDGFQAAIAQQAFAHV